MKFVLLISLLTFITVPAFALDCDELQYARRWYDVEKPIEWCYDKEYSYDSIVLKSLEEFEVCEIVTTYEGDVICEYSSSYQLHIGVQCLKDEDKSEHKIVGNCTAE